MKRIFIVLFFVVGILSDNALAQKEFTVSGIMQHSDLEGGCWYLQTKQEKFELTGSPENLQKCYVVGRPVTLRVRYKPMMASICMMGKVIEILDVYDTNFHARDPQLIDINITGKVHRTKAGCWYVETAKKIKYELDGPVPKQFMKIGKKYNRMSRVIPNESNCPDMNGKIVFPPGEIPGGGIKEKKFDPR